MDNKQKCIAIVALLLALVAISIGGSTTTTITNESIFEIEVNNTNLAPTVLGEINGTGDRIQGTTYYANETQIELFVWGHASTAGDTAEIHLFINGTKVSDTSGRPIGVAEQSNKSITAIIPRYASYMIETNNMHHYEWREYRIIAGQSDSANQSELNLKINKSGDSVGENFFLNNTGFMNITTNYNLSLRATNSTLGDYNGSYNLIRMHPDYTLFNFYNNYTNEDVNMYMSHSELNLDGKNLNDCGNCANTTDLNLKVNKSGDSLTGYLNFSENKGVYLQANSSAGGIQRLLIFKMNTPYDRPWMTWLDESDRNRVSMGYHTLNAADNSTHEDLEIKTSNETDSDMITRFALGTNKLLVNATFTDIDTFFIRSTASTIFQFITSSATITIGNGTNTASKIDFSGSRGQVQYSGSGMIVQSGSGKPLELHVNNSGSPSASSRAISIDVDRQVQMPGYSGSGTRAVCFDASGNIVASTNATSNYLTC